MSKPTFLGPLMGTGVGTRRATDAPAHVPVPQAPGGGVPPARHTTPQRRVALADIVSRKTPIAWFESVAIVQELCDAVLARGPADGLRVPELKHIALTPAGGIELLASGPEDHSAVHRASLVLLALTPEADLPLQLRMLALEAVSPSPRFASLEEFHAELEFFERPNRRNIARGAHGRFLSQQAHTADGGIPPALLQPATTRRHVQGRQRKWVVGTAALLLALAAAGAAWVWRWPEGGRHTQPAASPAGLAVQTQPAETPAAAGTSTATPAAGTPDAPSK